MWVGKYNQIGYDYCVYDEDPISDKTMYNVLFPDQGQTAFWITKVGGGGAAQGGVHLPQSGWKRTWQTMNIGSVQQAWFMYKGEFQRVEVAAKEAVFFVRDHCSKDNITEMYIDRAAFLVMGRDLFKQDLAVTSLLHHHHQLQPLDQTLLSPRQ